MEILLLYVPDTMLKGGVGWCTIDECAAGDNANGDSVGEHVEERGFASAGYSLIKRGSQRMV
jgi:hypothetical protein